MLFKVYVNFRWWLRPVCARRGHNLSVSGLYCVSCNTGKRDLLVRR